MPTQEHGPGQDPQPAPSFSQTSRLARNLPNSIRNFADRHPVAARRMEAGLL